MSAGRETTATERRLRLRADYRVKKYGGSWSRRLMPVILVDKDFRAFTVKDFYLQKLNGRSVIFAELEWYKP